MMIKKTLSIFIVIATLSCSGAVKEQQNTISKPKVKDWKQEVKSTLKLFGHRNWIVIADGAYPQQSNPAIKTISSSADQIETVAFVSQLVEEAKHVDANIFVDKEMAFVPEKDAKGIESYRTKLDEVLEGKPVQELLHEDIIRKLDTAGKLFNVLIIKTDLEIPYTSVFFQLECGYWNTEAENNLRTTLRTNHKNDTKPLWIENP